MKKFLFYSLLLGSIITSCGTKTTPEDEVKSYGKYFVEKLSANQLDSLKASYPDIASADSLVKFESDTVIVAETAPGKYDITLDKGATLKASRAEDGTITVAESRGLFAYPTDKVELAKKTGMWADSLNDKQMSERMKDDEFFKHINKTAKSKISRLLVIGPQPGFNDGGGNQSVTNKSDKTIDGADYSVVKALSYRGNYFSPGGVNYSTVKGKTLKPGESMKHFMNFAPMGIEYFERIKWKLSDDELIAKYVTFTGKEYQEYLDSKKSK